MSYARMGADSSNVYVFMSVGDREHPDGWLECHWCSFAKLTGTYRAFNTADMIRHLHQHVVAGEHVPDYVIPELLADDGENFPA
jgi:hypothetical protein